MLTQDEIMKAKDLPIETLKVDKWGEIGVRSLAGTERDEFEIKWNEYTNREGKVIKKNLRAFICAYCIVGEDGKRLFEDKDIELLGTKSAAALEQIMEVAMRLNGLSRKDIEGLAKN